MPFWHILFSRQNGMFRLGAKMAVLNVACSCVFRILQKILSAEFEEICILKSFYFNCLCLTVVAGSVSVWG